MNVRDSIKKVSALAGSTLMIGLTMGTAASLADFPGKFINNQGNPTAEVVVGSQGSVADVVGAVQIGAAMGQSSLRVGQVREQKSVEVAGGSSWSTDGALLNSQNDDLYGGEDIDTVRQTLTADDLDALATTTFQDAAGNSQDIEQYLYVGSQPSGFGNPGDTSDQDPFQYVYNPSTVSDTSYLYRLQANMGDGLELSDTSQDDDANDDVLGEDLTLFGKAFTISEDSFTSDHEGQLVLFGSSQEYDLETGESTEFEVDGTTHTIEVRAVTDPETAAFYVDGELREKTEDGSVTIDGTDVRVSDVIQTASDTSEGLVTFAIGSEEYVLEDGEPIEDGDGDEIEGAHVALEGSSVGSSNTLADDVELSTIEVSVGAADSDDTYVRAGESFQDPVFDDIVFRHSSMLPDAAEQEEPSVTVEADDDTASVTFTPQGEDETSVEFFYRDTGGATNELADSDGDRIVAVEGEPVEEEEYFVADAGGFTNLFEVRSVDVANDDAGAVDEGTVELRDVLSGSTAEIDLTETGDNTYRFQGTEVIDGQTYYFEYKDAGAVGPNLIGLYATWGTDATYDQTGAGGGFLNGVTTAFPGIETDKGGLLSFYDPSQDPTDFGTMLYEFTSGSSSNAHPMMFVDHGTNAGTYEDGDDILNISRIAGTATNLGGSTISDFSGSEYYLSASAADFDGTQPIIDSGGNQDLDDVSEIDRDGTAGILTGLAGTDLAHYDDAAGGANVYDPVGGIYGEDIYDTGGDGTIDAGDTRVTKVRVNSGTSDGDVVTVDLGLSTNAVVDSGDPDTGKSLDAFSSTPSVHEIEGGGTAGTLESGDTVVIDVNGDSKYDADVDIALNGNPGDGTDYDSEVTGNWETGQYTSNEAVIFDQGATDGTDDGTTTPDVIIEGGSVTIGTAGSYDATSGTVKYWDADGTGSYTHTTSDQDSVYVDIGDDGVDGGTDPDARLQQFELTYSAGSTVSSGDVDSDISVVAFASDEYYLDENNDGQYDNGEAILQNGAGTGADLESGDSVLVSGSFAGLAQTFPDGSSGDAVMFIGSTDYDGSQEILEIDRETDGGSDVALGGKTLNNFPSGIKHDNSNGYQDGDAIVDDSGSTSGEFDSGDTVLTGSLSTGSNIQYWSSDSSEVSGVSGLNSALPSSDPAVAFIQEEDDSDAQDSFVVEPAWDAGDSEVEVGGEDTSDALSQTGEWSRKNLESNDDVYVGYSYYGTYTREDTSDTGSVELRYPETQSTVGAAFTGAGDSLERSSVGQQQASIEYRGVRNNRVRGRLPAFASVDSEITPQQRTNRHMILVGGPAVNQLVADLAEQHDSVWTQGQWQDREGEAVLQLVEDAFADGNNALIVAGHSADDTVRAARYISDWKDHRSSLRGTNLYQPE